MFHSKKACLYIRYLPVRYSMYMKTMDFPSNWILLT